MHYRPKDFAEAIIQADSLAPWKSGSPAWHNHCLMISDDILSIIGPDLTGRAISSVTQVVPRPSAGRSRRCILKIGLEPIIDDKYRTEAVSAANAVLHP